ncbi:hypothetical protein M0R72_02555 [Candidatus Pacearchaeota archaeon]|jgi:hypothetical protein|nr:hypothetical protein [Candidatus Pacearchaeota archaeon]
MEIKIGSIIKIICINNVIEAGKLVEYTDEQMVLELFDRSLFIVQDPFKNVMCIRLTPQTTESSEQGEVFVELEPEPAHYYRQEDLRAKNLAELHKLKAAEERKRARELLQRSKNIETLPEVDFGSPFFTKSILKHPKKKAR